MSPSTDSTCLGLAPTCPSKLLQYVAVVSLLVFTGTFFFDFSRPVPPHDDRAGAMNTEEAFELYDDDGPHGGSGSSSILRK